MSISLVYVSLSAGRPYNSGSNMPYYTLISVCVSEKHPESVVFAIYTRPVYTSIERRVKSNGGHFIT